MAEHRGDEYDVRIDGNVSGQVAVGRNIRQTSSIGAAVAADDRAAVAALVAELRRAVAEGAPPEQHDEAVAKVDELGEAVLADAPDVGKMSDIRTWFGVTVPALARAVKEMILNPVVVKLVEAAGEVAATQFKALFP